MTDISDFTIIADLTEPCPQCGVPACGKEAYLWTHGPGENPVTIIFDRGLFDVMGEDYFSLHFQSVVYADLPGFMREWNEFRGWNEFLENRSYPVLVGEFLSSLELMRQAKLSDWLMPDFIRYQDAFLNFITSYDAAEKGLYILGT